MPFEPNTLFPGLLSESAARVAQAAVNQPGGACPASITREMGWNAVLIPEDQGGAGGEFEDLAAIIEGIATHAVSLPVITRCGVVPAILNVLPEQSDVCALRGQVAEGSIVVELGGPLHASDPTPPLSACLDQNSWRISGNTTGVELTEDCTHLLAICRSTTNGSNDLHAARSHEGENTPVLALVPTTMLNSKKVSFHTMDDRQIVVINMDGLTLTDDHILATGETAKHAIQAGWRIAAAATATDSVCSMGSALSRTISYLLERKQFGHALADFQALRHDVARLYVTYELCRSLLQSTLRTLEPSSDNEDDTSALDLLGLYIGQESIRFAETIIQLHGGMGMTREMPAAQLATRLFANALRFGDPLTYYRKIDNLCDRKPT